MESDLPQSGFFAHAPANQPALHTSSSSETRTDEGSSSPAVSNISHPIEADGSTETEASHLVPARHAPASATRLPSNQAQVSEQAQSHLNGGRKEERDRLLSSTEPSPGIVRKLTKTVIAVLVGGTLVILGILAFWTFLWFGNKSNAIWHRIMIGDHLTVIVTITSEALNQILGWMTGAACAMLAALALERAEVLFPQLASFTTARHGFGGGQSLAWALQIVRRKWASKGWSLLLPTIVIIVAVFQLVTSGTHTLLVSDINLAPLPNNSVPFNVSYGFAYHAANVVNQSDIVGEIFRTSTWKQKAPFYPTFAEYSEPPVVQDGVSDTGVLLRAFLPFQDAESRQTIHTYQGRTTVLDARVTCQLPVLLNTTVAQEEGLLIFTGYVRASRYTPRLGNVTYVSEQESFQDSAGNIVHNGPVPFTCAAVLADSLGNNELPDQWRITMCQLAEDGAPTHGWPTGISGGLVSEFKNYTAWIEAATSFNNSYSFGTAYLMLNVSAGIPYVWQENLKPGLRYAVEEGGTSGEWLKLSFPRGLGAELTLCYSAFDTADIAVNISSVKTRSESEPAYNFTSQMYQFGALRHQYGQPVNSTSNVVLPKDRDTLALEHQSWIADAVAQPPREPYLRAFTNLAWGQNGAGSSGSGNNGLWTGLLFSGYIPEGSIAYDPQFFLMVPDPMHIWLFQEIVMSGGSVAFGLSSLITLLSSIAYYDQIGQFDSTEAVGQSYFVTTNLPTRAIGWSIVTGYFCLNIIVIGCIVLWFVRKTRYTLLNQAWQQLAQATVPETAKYAEVATMMTDDELKALMKQTGLDKVHVQLRQAADNDRVVIECVEEPDLGGEDGHLEYQFVEFHSKTDRDEQKKRRWWNVKRWFGK